MHLVYTWEGYFSKTKLLVPKLLRGLCLPGIGSDSIQQNHPELNFANIFYIIFWIFHKRLLKRLKRTLENTSTSNRAVQAFQVSQKEVRVYVIDRGFDKRNSDISHNNLTYPYSLGSVPRPNEDKEDKTGGGGGGGSSCLVSKIGGERFGVFPNGPAFTIVKIGPNLSS